MSNHDTIMNVRLPKELHAQVQSLAKSQMMPMSVMMRLALAEYVKNHAYTALTSPLNDLTSKPIQKQLAKPSSQLFASVEEEADYDRVWS